MLPLGARQRTAPHRAPPRPAARRSATTRTIGQLARHCQLAPSASVCAASLQPHACTAAMTAAAARARTSRMVVSRIPVPSDLGENRVDCRASAACLHQGCSASSPPVQGKLRSRGSRDPRSNCPAWSSRRSGAVHKAPSESCRCAPVEDRINLPYGLADDMGTRVWKRG
jgi:hypothetical protein